MLAGAATLLAGCKPGLPQWASDDFPPVRYRLRAEVDTPSGVKSGSSVIEVTMNRSITNYQLHGEAVAVDLPGGQVLFVLLRAPTNIDWAASLPGFVPPESNIAPQTFKERQAQLERQLAWIRADRAVHYVWGGDVAKDRAQYLPYIVRFRDLRDPKSVEQVAPDDLAKSFGPGYRLTSLTVQSADEAVTTGIVKRLGWLQATHGALSQIPVSQYPQSGMSLPLYATLTESAFWEGISK
jgi:hypothetical protein